MAEVTDRQVLPTNVSPVNYAITLTPDLQNSTFTGEEVIQLQVKSATSTISLNTNELRITSASLVLANGSTVAPVDIVLDEGRQTTSMIFPQEIAVGEVNLRLAFEGTLNNRMVGFYRSEYQDSQGVTHVMATTQFEATDARRAFPCWDEPAVKATFEITLVIPETMVGLSNMNVIRETRLDHGKKEIVFAKTPIMSTYLIAFCVGDLDYVEDRTKEGVLIRVYTPIGISDQGKFALQVSGKVLSFFSKYFGEPYPLPKLDSIAIPDFAAGAMENWGLVTYRTIYLLYDEKQSSLTAKKNIAYVIAHELAHQWFGNLVTMEWWTHLWLNEGFATYVGWLAVDHLFPEWDIWTDFLVNEQGGGLKLDSLRSSHPIEVDVKKPEEIDQIFDNISYAKGASVIQMLVKFLGSESFLNGVRHYLQRYKYGNATTQDLWKALTEHSQFDIGQMMSGWTQFIGYPIVTIDLTSDGIVASQRRYLSSETPTPEELEQLWWVPLNIRCLNEKNEIVELKELLKTKNGTFSLPKGYRFLKVNSMECGFYRVKYTDTAFQHVLKAIEDNLLTAADRVGVLSDAFALAQSGHLTTDNALKLLSSFQNETNFVVWSTINSSLSSLKSVWYEQPQDIINRINHLGQGLYAPVIKKLGWEYPEGEPVETVQLRSLIISGSGKCGDKDTIAEAKSRFARYVNGDSTAIHPDLRGIVFSIVVMNGGVDEFNAIKKIYLESTVPDIKKAALISLGLSADSTLVDTVLNFSLSPEVRSQDVPYLISSIGHNPKGRAQLWEFVKAKWNVFIERYKELGTLGSVITRSTEGFATMERAEEVKGYFQSVPPSEIASATRAIQQSIESIQGNARWLTRDAQIVSDWLKANIAL